MADAALAPSTTGVPQLGPSADISKLFPDNDKDLAKDRESALKDLEAGRAQREKGAQERAEAEKGKPPVFEPPPSPDVKPTDPQQIWASSAMLFAAIGSIFARRPIVTAMNAASKVLQGYRQGDLEAADQAYQTWKVSSENATKAYNFQMDQYKEALGVAKDDIAEGSAQMLSAASQVQDSHMQEAAKRKDFIEMQRLVTEQQRVFGEMQKAQGQLEEQKHHTDAEIEHWRQLEQYQRGELDERDAANQPKIQEFDQKNDLWKEWQKGNPQATTEQKIAAHRSIFASGAAAGITLSDDTADLIADQVIAGNRQAVSGLARSAASVAKVNEAITRKAKEQGLSGAELAAAQAAFAGAVSGERTLGTRTANMEVAANEVKYMAPLALAASNTVERSEYPNFNAILLAGEKGTGNKDVVRFGLAANALIYSYAKFLNPTGIPTDADKAKATDILSTAWSKGQFSTAVDQIQKEIATGKAAVRDTKQEFKDTVSGKSSAGDGVSSLATGKTLPPDLPPPTGHAEGSVAKDDKGSVVAKIHNGQWVLP